MNLVTSAEWPQIDSGEWQWGTVKTKVEDMIKGCKPTIDQHFLFLAYVLHTHFPVTRSKLTNISIDILFSHLLYNVHRTWRNTHFSVNIFCHWSQYSWSCSMCMHKKVWLFHSEKPHRILQDLWRSSKIWWGSLKIWIFQGSLKDLQRYIDPKGNL